MRIAVDIDSTLFDFCAQARMEMMAYAAEGIPTWDVDKLRNAVRSDWGEWQTPYILLGETLWSRVLDRTHSPEAILEQVPFNGAVDVLNEWAGDEGHDVFFISSRDEGDRVASATREWLQKIGIDDPELLCTGRAGSKIPHLIERSVEILIDDRPQTLVEFAYLAPSAIAAIGISHDYNRGLSDIPRVDIVDSWEEIPEIIDERSLFAY